MGNDKKKMGRPEGTSKFKEKTVPIRVPLTLVPYVEELLETYFDNGFQVTVIRGKNGIIKNIRKKSA